MISQTSVVAPQWRKAPRLKRVFNIDISDCNQCGSRVKKVACAEDPDAMSTSVTAFKNKEKEAGVAKQTLSRVYQIAELHRRWIYLRRLNLPSLHFTI